MSVAPATSSSILVVISGVTQAPSTYSVVGTTLTFSTAPPSGTANISVRYLGIPASGVTTTAYRTLTEFTATASQTTFTPPSYTVGFIAVYQNGVMLGSTDYTATNGTTVVLAVGALVGDLISTESFYVSSVLNALPVTGGTISGNLVVTGTASITGVTTLTGGLNTPLAVTSGGTGVATSTGSGANVLGTSPTLTTPTISTITSAAATALTLQSASTTAVTIDTSQNVGIGTTAPSQKLEIYAAANSLQIESVVRNDQAGSGVAAIGFNVSSSAAAETTSTKAGIGLARTHAYGVGSLCFYNNGTGSAGNFTTADERMRIDSSGRVTTPFQTGFIAKGLAAQTTYTQGQVVVFNSASYNVGSGYNTSNGRFTAPVTGLYSFTFQLYFNPGNGNAPLTFYKNGVMEIMFLQGVTMNGIGLSTLISLSASDYVEVRVRDVVGASATVYNGTDHTQFTGYLLG